MAYLWLRRLRQQSRSSCWRRLTKRWYLISEPTILAPTSTRMVSLTHQASSTWKRFALKKAFLSLPTTWVALTASFSKNASGCLVGIIQPTFNIAFYALPQYQRMNRSGARGREKMQTGGGQRERRAISPRASRDTSRRHSQRST